MNLRPKFTRAGWVWAGMAAALLQWGCSRDGRSQLMEGKEASPSGSSSGAALAAAAAATGTCPGTTSAPYYRAFPPVSKIGLVGQTKNKYQYTATGYLSGALTTTVDFACKPTTIDRGTKHNDIVVKVCDPAGRCEEWSRTVDYAFTDSSATRSESVQRTEADVYIAKNGDRTITAPFVSASFTVKLLSQADWEMGWQAPYADGDTLLSYVLSK